jgi:hypothetical protein
MSIPKPEFNLGDLVSHKPGYFEDTGKPYKILGRAYFGEFSGWVYIIDAPGKGDGLEWLNNFNQVSFLPELETTLNCHSSNEKYLSLVSRADNDSSDDCGGNNYYSTTENSLELVSASTGMTTNSNEDNGGLSLL